MIRPDIRAWLLVLLVAAASLCACDRAPSSGADPVSPSPALLIQPGTVPDLLPFDDARYKSEGGLAPSVVRRVVGKHKSSFKVCYRKALAENPEARGEVRVRFTVSSTGRVATVDIQDVSLNNPTATACLTRVVRRLRFPEWTGQARATVEYPMVFAP